MSFKSRLHAKAVTYYLNAYFDSLNRQPNSPVNDPLEQYRNKLLAKYQNENVRQLSSYCQYWWNGYYDYIIAAMIDKYFFSDTIRLSLAGYRENNPYRNIQVKISSLVEPIILLINGRLHHTNNDHEYIAAVIIITQHINQKVNLRCIDELKSQPNSQKSNIIHQISSSQNSQYKQYCINTLKAANRWDKIFVLLVYIIFRPRFRLMHKSTSD